MCGIFGIWGVKDSSAIVALGLHALQHRGQESAGIISWDGEGFKMRRRLGLVGDHFVEEDTITNLDGIAAIGHVRYSTAGDTETRNIQPLLAELATGGVAISHNGNLTNAHSLRKSLVERGCIFQSVTDTEVIIHLMAKSHSYSVVDRLVDSLKQIVGAYSLVLLTPQGMIGVRDPLGIRPLVLGQVEDKYVLASEDTALYLVGGKPIRDIEPGEIVHITDDGIKSYYPFKPQQRKFCVFEHIYFAKPDTKFDDENVYEIRKRLGMELAKESPVDADVVVPVPDSGNPAAIGYSHATGLNFDLGVIRSHYVGRTFIEPTQKIRHLGVKLKHRPSVNTVKGKRIILVDDSIVRGTTMKSIVAMLRHAGASEIHVRISSPPIAYPCYYGIDTPDTEELISANKTASEIAEMVGADSLEFLSMDGIYRAIRGENRENTNPQYCDACFSGEYPVPLIDNNRSKFRLVSTLG